MRRKKRTICFVTGTRAEFGLMRTTLEAIRAHPNLKLKIIATGMHLSRAHGNTVEDIRRSGFKVDATVKWQGGIAEATGNAIAALARQFSDDPPDIVMVVGDRVEAFAAASATHLCHIPVAHIHGGDRALGQVDDSLRHAITKLAHVHFPATRQSANRLQKLGEDRWRIHLTGSPAVDNIRGSIAKDLKSHVPYALIVLHPVEADAAVEYRRARMVFAAIRSAKIPETVIIYPNNDPGHEGIIRAWKQAASRVKVLPSISRPIYLSMLRDAVLLAGNSSSGIIEAASFSTPVIDIGPRQVGRERSENVTNVPYRQSAIAREAARIWNGGKPLRPVVRNVYGNGAAGKRIAAKLAKIPLDARLLAKLIAY